MLCFLSIRGNVTYSLSYMTIEPIATAKNDFTGKFGIPRQAWQTEHIETRIVFLPPYRVREALRGIEEYSHLWLIWGFHANATDNAAQPPAFTPTVRPPRLGGNKRMGVFATRSPFRPNGLGLSSVRLLRIEETPEEGCVLVVSGADLLDGTPIYDIKPYLSYSDAHPDARNGFGEATKDYRLQVELPPTLRTAAQAARYNIEGLCEVLSQDPRPAYQHDAGRVYRLDFAGRTVSFTVAETAESQSGTVQIQAISGLDRTEPN